MAVSMDGGGDVSDDLPAPAEAYAPIAILDFLATAETSLRRLGQQTGVPAWVLARRIDQEWVVLASESHPHLRPGDVLTELIGAVRHLNRLAVRWEQEVVVDLHDQRIHPPPDRAPVPGDQVDDPPGLAAFPLWVSDGLFGAVCALPQGPGQAAALGRRSPLVHLAVELLGSVLELDLDRSRLQRRLDAAQSAALSDPLTGLGNRRAFEHAVEREEARCSRFGHRAGVMMLDLDDLKVVNDTEGHDAGDDLLRRAAATIRATLRAADQAFRIGGDEFALLLPEVTSSGLDRLQDRLTAALDGAGVSASIGSALRQSGGDLRTSTSDADAAMYERKRARALAGRSGPGRRAAPP